MSIKKPQITRGILLRPDTVALEGKEGEIKIDSADNKIKSFLGGTSREVLTADQTATVTNKTLNADNNTISELETDNLKAGVLNTSTTLAAASDTQVPSALAVKTYVDNSIATVNDASEISYSNATSGLTATNVQTAIDEVDGNVDNLVTLSGVPLDSVDLGTFTGTTIPDNQTNKQALQALETGLESHLSDTSDAHDASAISVVPTGNLASSEVQAALVELQGDIDTINGSFVAGPVSSTDNAISRFDGTTGKLVQNSLVTIDDTGIVSGPTQLNTDNIRLDGNTISSTDTNGNLEVTPNGTGVINLNKDSRFAQDVAFQITTDATTTGANATLVTPATKIIRLTNGSLSSIDGIPAGSQGQQITVINHSGSTVTINDNTGATAANRVLTGQKTSIQLKDEASLILEYDSTETRWMVIGGTGGAGSASTYIPNSDAEAGVTGHVAYADAAAAAPVDGTGGTPNITITRTTSSPLEGTGSFLITKDAVNRQGQGVSIDFTIPSGRQASIIPISFTYETSVNYVDGDCRVYIIDVTNTRVIELAQRDLAANTRGLYQSSFQASADSVSYRLVIHVATVSALAYTVKYDEVIVYPRPVVKGSVTTDWIPYTPTLSNFGTTSGVSFFYRRNGENLEVQGVFTTGTLAAALGTISLPNVSIDNTILTLNNATSGPGHHVGWISQNGGNTLTKAVTATGTNAGQIYHGALIGAANNLTPANANACFNPSAVVSVFFQVPILGWSSNLVLSEDTGNRLITATYNTNAGTALTANVTDIPFTTREYDLTSSWNGSQFVAPETGYYSFNGSINISVASGATIRSYVEGVLSKIVTNEQAVNTTIKQFAGQQFLTKGQALSFRINSASTLVASTSLHYISIFKISTPQTIAASEDVVTAYSSSSGAVLASDTTVPFDIREIDTHNSFASNTFTAPVTAKYLLSAQIYASASLSTGQQLQLQIRKNAATIKQTLYRATNTVASNYAVGIPPTVVSLNKGDTIIFRYVGSVSVTLISDSTLNYFSITKVG